ncbi:MAG TPA: hypothetical protein VM056_01765 [Terriglobales bacterium]|nr:hypothetical protein [Terriglobales bacterium]
MGQRRPLPEQNITELAAMKKLHTKSSPNQLKVEGDSKKSENGKAEGNRKKLIKRGR